MLLTEQLEHALPFRALFAELEAVRPNDFRAGIGPALFTSLEWEALIDRLGPVEAQEAATEQLHIALRRQEHAYEVLAAAKEQLEHRTPGSPITAATDLEALTADCFEADQPLKRVLYHCRGNALTFSGGGIRSASFCLGVLQGLARFTSNMFNPSSAVANETGLLYDVQYLSTVSGGGYVGSWFSAWTFRVAQSLHNSTGISMEKAWPEAYRKVIGWLAGNGRQTVGDPDPEPVRHLRQFTSYLAPRLGFTLDVWSLAAIVLRNLLVNWMMLGPLLLAIVLVPLLAAHLTQEAAPLGIHLPGLFFYPLLGILLGLAAVSAGFSLPSFTTEPDSPFRLQRRLHLGGVNLVFMAPMVITCWLLCLRFYPHYPNPYSPARAAALSAVSAIPFGILALLRWYTDTNRRALGRTVGFSGRLGRWITGVILSFTAISCSLFTGIATEMTGSRLLCLLPDPTLLHDLHIGYPLYTAVAFPAFLLILLLGSTLFSAIVNKLEMEIDREWWARAGGLLMIASFAWFAGISLAILTDIPFKTWVSHWLPLNGLALGGLTSWLGKSSKSPAGTRPEKESSQGAITRFFQRQHLVLPALSILSLAIIALMLARGAEQLRKHFHLTSSSALDCLLLLIVLLLGAGAINWIININVFSLHGLYRVRLARAFLGPSNQARTPDPFTHFDSEDTPYMTELACGPGVPLHIIGTTLNLVGTKRAEWRQRKAESFTFSSVTAGSWRLNYVGSDSYGGSRGTTLATAMAISGAAANPNMGYHSSPLVTLLMTLFNVRLGWWLPNPSIPNKKNLDPDCTATFLRHSSPTRGVLPLIQELFGKTDDDGHWIELSDGGHFENLGLYEMVLRRCANIIVVDASADPDFHFEDLGNALRKIEIDLGIPIRFQAPIQMHSSDAPEAKDNRYCAVADIDYSCVDSACFADASFSRPDSAGKPINGRLIYIKACLTGREPVDVTEYASSHSNFPHEPTTDQFFTEAQFESYRHLGSSVVDEIAGQTKGTGWASWTAAAESHSSANNGQAPQIFCRLRSEVSLGAAIHADKGNNI